MTPRRCPVCDFLHQESTPACHLCWQQACVLALRALRTIQAWEKPSSKTVQVVYGLTRVDYPSDDIDFLIRDLGYTANPEALERLLHRAASNVHAWAHHHPRQETPNHKPDEEELPC